MKAVNNIECEYTISVLILSFACSFYTPSVSSLIFLSVKHINKILLINIPVPLFFFHDLCVLLSLQDVSFLIIKTLLSSSLYLTGQHLTPRKH